MKHIRGIALIIAIGIVFLSGEKSYTRTKPFAFSVTTGKNFRISLKVGPEYMDGDMIYQIGGKTTLGGETYYLHFPISELKWPTKAIFMKSGITLEFYDTFELYGNAAITVKKLKDTMEDSDWTKLDMPELKTIYSESDSEMKGYYGEFGGRWWFAKAKISTANFYLGAGAGYLHQFLKWEAQNVVQVSIYPEYNGSYKGLAIKYETTLDMPFAELVAKLDTMDRLVLQLSGGFSPYLRLQDKDDHVLRYKFSEADTDGYGFKGTASMTLRLIKNLSLIAEGNLLTLKTQGTSKSHFYAGENYGSRHEIDKEITSTQISGALYLSLVF